MNPNTQRITDIISAHSQALTSLMKSAPTPEQRIHALAMSRTFLALADEYAALTETVEAAVNGLKGCDL